MLLHSPRFHGFLIFLAWVVFAFQSSIVRAVETGDQPSGELQVVNVNCDALLSTQRQPQQSFSPLVARAFQLMPKFFTRTLTLSSDSLRKARIAQLYAEIAVLIPGEAYAFMAMIPWRSYDYFLDSLPDVPETQGLVDGKRRDAHKLAWVQRLISWRQKLQELQTLEGPRAATSLSLGIYYGFTFGFENFYLNWWSGARVYESGGGFFESISQAIYHLRMAQLMFEREQGAHSPHALLAKFMLGKHALAAAQIHSNAGTYLYSGGRMPPDPQSFEYLALARGLLTSVADAAHTSADLQLAAVREAPFTSGFDELYFETRYFLL